jgi:hypothetical protein
MCIISNKSVIILNINGINAPNKRLKFYSRYENQLCFAYKQFILNIRAEVRNIEKGV